MMQCLLLQQEHITRERTTNIHVSDIHKSTLCSAVKFSTESTNVKFNKALFTKLLSAKEQEQQHHSAKQTCIQRIHERSFGLTMKSNSDCFKILKVNQIFLSMNRRKTASEPITKLTERCTMVYQTYSGLTL
jgi:hypothetical protein